MRVFSFLLLASSALPVALSAQADVTATLGKTAEFHDLSGLAAEPAVLFVVGELQRLKEGRRERLEDNTDLGGAGTSMQISGTVYYKVAATFAIDVYENLRGELPRNATVRCELQMARLPSGDYQRRFRVGSRHLASEGMRALFVVRKAKGSYELADLVPADPVHDKGDLARSFATRAADLVAVAGRLAELREACALADRLRDKPDALAAKVETLRALLDKKVELRDPAHERWVQTHAGPLERALREKLDGAGKTEGGRG